MRADEAPAGRRRGWFVTSSGTSAGKTFVTRGLVRSLAQRQLNVIGLKPLETGCDPDPLDALALERAASISPARASLALDVPIAADGAPRDESAAPESNARHEQAAQPGANRLRRAAVASPHFYRAQLPLSPYAVQLMTGQPRPDLERIAQHINDLAPDFDHIVVEGAGGLLVPLDAQSNIADLACRLGYPLLLIAADQLGVLSHVLTAAEAARARGLEIAAVVLTQQAPSAADVSAETNSRILAERLKLPVLRFPYSADDDDALAAAAISCELTGLVLADLQR
jgi:dethiobiotin synthetase